MTKIHIVHTAPINSPGSSPRLTRAQAWAGLARKARHPEDFVPVVAGCEILRDTASLSPGTDAFHPSASNPAPPQDEEIECIVFFRPGVPHATQIRETCTLRAPCRLDYDMEDGSTAVNLIGVGPSLLPSLHADAEGERERTGAEEEELYLTFAFCWEHVGLQRGGEEERVLRERYEKVFFPFQFLPRLFVPFPSFAIFKALIVDRSPDRGRSCTGYNCWHEEASVSTVGAGRLVGCIMNGERRSFA